MESTQFPDPSEDWGSETPSPPSGRRPTGLTVMAVLAWVFGGMFLLCTPFQVISAVAPDAFQAFQGGGPANPMVEAYAQVPWLKPFMIGTNVVSIPLFICLIIGGIGLWQMRRWGWLLCNLYAVVDIARLILGMGITALVVIPVMQSNMPSDPALRGGMMGGMIGGICCGLAFGLILPMAMLIVINVGASGRAKREAQ